MVVNYAYIRGRAYFVAKKIDPVDDLASLIHHELTVIHQNRQRTMGVIEQAGHDLLGLFEE